MSPGGEGEERTGAEIRSHTLPRFSSSSLSEGAPSAQGEAWPRAHALRCRPWGVQRAGAAQRHRPAPPCKPSDASKLGGPELESFALRRWRDRRGRRASGGLGAAAAGMEPAEPPPPASHAEPSMPPPPVSAAEPGVPPPMAAEPGVPPPTLSEPGGAPPELLTVPEYGDKNGDMANQPSFETDNLGGSPVVQLCGKRVTTGTLRMIVVLGCASSSGPAKPPRGHRLSPPPCPSAASP